MLVQSVTIPIKISHDSTSYQIEVPVGLVFDAAISTLHQNLRAKRLGILFEELKKEEIFCDITNSNWCLHRRVRRQKDRLAWLLGQSLSFVALVPSGVGYELIPIFRLNISPEVKHRNDDNQKRYHHPTPRKILLSCLGIR